MHAAKCGELERIGVLDEAFLNIGEGSSCDTKRLFKLVGPAAGFFYSSSFIFLAKRLHQCLGLKMKLLKQEIGGKRP